MCPYPSFYFSLSPISWQSFCSYTSFYLSNISLSLHVCMSISILLSISLSGSHCLPRSLRLFSSVCLMLRKELFLPFSWYVYTSRLAHLEGPNQLKIYTPYRTHKPHTHKHTRMFLVHDCIDSQLVISCVFSGGDVYWKKETKESATTTTTYCFRTQYRPTVKSTDERDGL